MQNPGTIREPRHVPVCPHNWTIHVCVSVYCVYAYHVCIGPVGQMGSYYIYKGLLCLCSISVRGTWHDSLLVLKGTGLVWG